MYKNTVWYHRNHHCNAISDHGG